MRTLQHHFASSHRRPASAPNAGRQLERAHRVRVGVALERAGVGGYVGRLRDCWERKSLGTLIRKSYGKPFFVTTEPFTNAAPTTR
jgi:hypothetical protein